MGRFFGLILCAESIFMLPSLILALVDAIFISRPGK